MLNLIPHFLVYYKDEGEVKHVSYCFISDDITHNVSFVYAINKVILPELKVIFPDLSKVVFFTHGCAGQNKNCKTMYNLCELSKDLQGNGTFLPPHMVNPNVTELGAR